MYALKNVLTQSPEKVKTTILAVAGVVLGVKGYDPSLLETVGVGIAVERLLDLFYVAPMRAGGLQQVQDAVDAKALEGIDLGKSLAWSGSPQPGVGVDPAPLVDL